MTDDHPAWNGDMGPCVCDVHRATNERHLPGAETWRRRRPRPCRAPMTEPLGACIFPGCVSQDRHWHGGFPGGYDDPADPDGPPIPFTRDPDPGVRDYHGARLADLDDALAGTAPAVESAITVTAPKPRRVGPPDPDRSRMGRNNRKRGNAAELDVARAVGGRKVGPMQWPWDVELPGYARLQVRKLATPPSVNDIRKALEAIARTPGEAMPGYVWIEPGRGGERLIVFRFRDWQDRHGPVLTEEATP